MEAVKGSELSRRRFLKIMGAAAATTKLKDIEAFAEETIPDEVMKTFRKTAEQIKKNGFISTIYSKKEVDMLVDATLTKLPKLYMDTLREYEKESGIDLMDKPPEVLVWPNLVINGKESRGAYSPDLKKVVLDTEVLLALVDEKRRKFPKKRGMGTPEVAIRHEFCHYWDKRALEEGRVDWIARMKGNSLKKSNAGYEHASMNWGLIAYMLGRKEGRGIDEAMHEGTKKIMKFSFSGKKYGLVDSLKELGLDWQNKPEDDEVLKSFLKDFTNPSSIYKDLEAMGKADHRRTEAIMRLYDHFNIGLDEPLRYMQDKGDIYPWRLDPKLNNLFTPRSEFVRGPKREPQKPATLKIDGKKMYEELMEKRKGKN